MLGPTGRNFAAGMSGGVAYVYDPGRTFGQRVNLEMVDVEPLDPTDAFTVRALVERHGVETESAVAAGLLERWDTEVARVRQGHAARLPARPRGDPAGRGRGALGGRGRHGGRTWVSRPGSWSSRGELPRRRPVSVRLRDWREVYEPFGEEATKEQGARCMDCGIPFCHDGCPLGNLIPEWNDLVYRDDWPDAIERLHATNNFPEFTGRLCPAPVRGGLRARDQRRPGHHRADRVRDRRAGLGRGLGDARSCRRCAPASRWPSWARARPAWRRPSSWRGPGTLVTVFERAEKPGGLLRYGIPEFKMEKAVLDRRLAQMEAEGVTFVCSTSVGGRPAGSRGGGGRGGARRGARPRDGVRARRRRCGRRPRCGPPSTRSCWPAGPRCRATCRCPGGSSTASTWPWST